MLDIRPATKADAGPLGPVGYAAWQKGIGRLIPESAARRVDSQAFIDLIDKAWPGILVADIDGIPVGFVATGSAANYITDLWVSPDFEGRGVGSKLVAEIELRIQKAGFDTVEIEVMTDNQRARDLYLRLGYSVLYEREKHDDHLMIDLHKTRLAKTFASLFKLP
jgi:[ribosomal protein S18]-alanine N-acetyltransferase